MTSTEAIGKGPWAQSRKQTQVKSSSAGKKKKSVATLSRDSERCLHETDAPQPKDDDISKSCEGESARENILRFSQGLATPIRRKKKKRKLLGHTASRRSRGG